MKTNGAKSYEDFLAIKDELTASLANVFHRHLISLGSDIRLIPWFSAAARVNLGQEKKAA